MSLSDYAEVAFLNYMFRNTQMPTPPATIYVALHTGVPTEDTANSNEASGGSYTRAAMTTGAAGTGVGSAWNAPVNDSVDAALKVVDNVADINFPTPTAPWGTLTHFSLWDAASGGNKLHIGQLLAAMVTATGVPVKFSLGDLDIKME